MPYLTSKMPSIFCVSPSHAHLSVGTMNLRYGNFIRTFEMNLFYREKRGYFKCPQTIAINQFLEREGLSHTHTQGFEPCYFGGISNVYFIRVENKNNFRCPLFKRGKKYLCTLRLIRVYLLINYFITLSVHKEYHIIQYKIMNN